MYIVKNPLFEVNDNIYLPKQLANTFFNAMGYAGETLDNIRVGRVHDRGDRQTMHIYRQEEEGRQLLGKIRVTNHGASYTGLNPLEKHFLDDLSPPKTEEYFIGESMRKHFKALEECLQQRKAFFFRKKPTILQTPPLSTKNHVDLTDRVLSAVRQQ